VSKEAKLDHPIHPLLADRWSPYAFDPRPVSAEDLRSIFEAARWAPSSYNEQPWRYVLATKDDAVEHERLLSCLVEGNRVWASNAPVLALGIVVDRFVRNDKPNAAAEHDLGLAAGNICVEATARGLYVHQMIGILPDRARDLYGIPDGHRALTGLAIGYKADPSALDEKLRQRDTAERTRRPLADFVFSKKWGTSAPLSR
jgi:nitroreductase